ncbi:MAG: Chondroitin synthase [Deltaproteobacteria bacterium ADurb.Bin151]|nr:MAG: Chondroitin synthase [Deltaproteobacteria bacterium ADurb.Bin151]
MKLKLSEWGYRLDSTTNVWSKSDFSGITYSDGDEVEQRIAAIVEQASDFTVLSTELRQNCTDWPSLYHLSNSRANILRPFESSLHGNILEIGAGCGAITRYLGECKGNVLALEGSARRAAIARSRTRDLPNVTVVADNFEQFQCNEQFDIITLIGVLEYANLFISHGNPALSMLQRVRSLLKPQGKLIIAIENQLGLKYFAGAPEDHFGKSMHGIENRYQSNQPQTYGRQALSEMLKQAGFSYSEFMAPFPDYKLPFSIVTEKGFSHKGFDAAALAWQCVKRDPQLPSVLAFAPELVWPSLVKNGVALDFSNSFLVVAGDSVNHKADSSILAWHFTTERSKEFCKVTRFLQRTNRLIETYCYPLSPDSPNHSRRRLLTFRIQEKAKYVQGRPLPQELIHIVTHDGWRIEDVGNFFKKYLEYLVSYASEQGVSLNVSSPESKIPGEYFDLIPQNIIVGHDGKWSVIDQEWVLNENMPVGWLLFRSLLTLINSVTRFGLCTDEFVNTAFGFIKAVFKAMCFSVTEEQMESYGRRELAVQEEVSGKKLDQMLNSWRTTPLQRLNLNQALIERDGLITSLNQIVSNRDEQIVNRDKDIDDLRKALVDRDLQITNLSQIMSNRDEQIANRHKDIDDLREALVDRDLQITSLNQIVSNRDEQIANRHKDIVDLRAALVDNEKQITSLKQIVSNRDEQIANRHKDIVDLRAALVDRDLQITSLNQIVSNRDEQIANRDKDIADLRSTLVAHEEQFAGLNQAVSERDGQIASLTQIVSNRDEQIANRHKDIDDLREALVDHEKQMTGLNQILAERDAQIVSLHQSVAERDGQIHNLNQAVAERDGLMAGLNQIVTERDAQIVTLHQSVAERDGQIALIAGQLNNERATITEILHSTSWRFTIPLRFIGTIFKSATYKFRSVVSHSLRVFYHQMPISEARKTDLKSFIYNHFALLLKNTKSYQHWIVNHPKASPSKVISEAKIPSSEPPDPCSSVSQVIQKVAIPSGEPHDPYDDWIEVNKWNAKRETFLRQRLQEISHAPLLSVIMPVYDPPVEYLNRAIASVCSQVYGNWELCIADDKSQNGEVRSALLKWSETDERIKVCYRETNGNISIATNSAAALAGGSHLVFLDQDDLLTPDALGEIALYIAEKPETDILYSDDDKIDTEGKRFAPQFKPDWSPELLLSYMYFSHAFVVSRSLFQEVGGARIGFEGSQDYDLALRASEKARHVGHIPLVLYHWRVLPNSTASSAKAKPDSMEAGRKAVQDALSRRGLQAAAYQPDWAVESGVGIFSHRFVHNNPPEVTIIIPTKDQVKVLKKCVESILKMTDYPNYEILIIDNDSVEPMTAAYLNKVSAHSNVRVVRICNPAGGFDYAYINNRAVEFARSEYVLFLNNDIEVRRKDWLSQMVGYGQIPGVGATGAKLLYPDRRIQHAGVLIKFYHGMAGHAFKGVSEHETGYLAYPKVLRNYSAVTAACLLTPRKLFIEMGGFDEKDFKVAYNDVDYCGRLLNRGYRVVYTPEAELIHHEGFSRGFCDNPRENVNFRTKYYGKKDRYYNPSLSLDNEYFEVWPRAVFTGEFPKTLKILMCTHNLNHEGAPYSQYEMTVGLKEKGILDPIVFSPVDGPLRALYESRGIRVIINPALGYIFEIAGYRERLKAFTVFIKELGVEMVYANTLINFHVIAAARDAGLPSIWNIRESEPWQYYQEMWGEELAAEAARCFTYPYKVIFVAHTTKQIYKQFEGRHNFHVIYNGLDLNRLLKEAGKYDRKAVREELGIGDDELAILLPGTVCERKGQQDLVRALERLNPDCLKKIKCFIVGDWQTQAPYNQELREMAASLPPEAKNRLSILPISAEIFKYYKIADIFVCSSRIESFPRIILEAMAFNLPIITTPVFGIQEQVCQNVNALFYPPGDYAALADALEKLITDEGMRRRFSENAPFVLRQLETFDEMTDAYAVLFKEGYFSCGRKARMPEAITAYHAGKSAIAGSLRKVTFLTSYKDENSQRFRVYNLIEGLTEASIECAVLKEDFGGSLDGVLDSDLLVVFRVGASDNVRQILDIFKGNGIPTVFDVDDLVFEPESAHLLHGLTTLDKKDRQRTVEGFERLRETLLLCDYSTCTTKTLSKRIESLGKRCFVISNTINKKQFELAQELKRGKKSEDDAKVRIGYFSGTRTHDKDFREVADALYKVMAENPQTEFHLVGILDLDSKFSKFGERLVRQPLMDYFKMLCYLFWMDINLAPLEMNNVFTACKSELKIFEAGLVEIPTIASATDSYAGCITDGANGFLAASKGEWVEKLENLIKDRKLRRRIGQRAEQDFMKKFFIRNSIKDVIGNYKEICRDHGKMVERFGALKRDKIVEVYDDSGVTRNSVTQ